MQAKYGSYGILSALTLAVAGAYSLPAAAHDTVNDSRLASATKISAEDLNRAFQASSSADDTLAAMHIHTPDTNIDVSIVSPEAAVAGQGTFDV